MVKRLKELQREVLVGILLGDAHLVVNKSKTKKRLVVLQSAKHKDYVFHLDDIFKGFVSTPPQHCVFKDKRNLDRMYERYYFSTRLSEFFMPYAHLFYPDKKEVEEQIDTKQKKQEASCIEYKRYFNRSRDCLLVYG